MREHGAGSLQRTKTERRFIFVTCGGCIRKPTSAHQTPSPTAAADAARSCFFSSLNGSVANIAGISDATGRIVAMMPPRRTLCSKKPSAAPMVGACLRAHYFRCRGGGEDLVFGGASIQNLTINDAVSWFDHTITLVSAFGEITVELQAKTSPERLQSEPVSARATPLEMALKKKRTIRG